jgi:hypothetical protein
MLDYDRCHGTGKLVDQSVTGGASLQPARPLESSAMRLLRRPVGLTMQLKTSPAVF